MLHPPNLDVNIKNYNEIDTKMIIICLKISKSCQWISIKF